MKKILIPFLSLFLWSSIAIAQDTKQERSGKSRQGQMQNRLDLTEEQKAQIRRIKEIGGGRDEFRAILTEEQLAKLDELRKNSNRKGNRGESNGKRQRGSQGKTGDQRREGAVEPAQEAKESSETDSDVKEPDNG